MVIILMGVSGCGKTTIGLELNKALGWRFYDGDDFHNPENVKKMKNGIALTDEDRMPWLNRLTGEIKQWNQNGQNVILACSALKAGYRKSLGVDQKMVKTVFLKGSFPLLKKRLEDRENHFMNPELLDSQLKTLEEPAGGVEVSIDQTPGQIAETIIKKLDLQTAQHR